MKDPIAVFLKEHEENLVFLKKLKVATNEIKKNGFSEKTFSQLKKTLEFVDEEITVHNLKEETALFPIIEKYVDGPTISLREDHLKLKKLNKKLQRSIKSLKENLKDEIAKIEFIESSDDIVQLMINHIHTENQILFPLVKKFFSKEEIKLVSLRMN